MRQCAILVLSSPLLLLLGCSSPSTGGTSTSGSSSSGSSTSSGGLGDADGGAFDAGGAVTTYTTGMGPITLGPGEEETNCIVVHLGNAEGGYVRRFRADLGAGSHHMIVYESDDTTESPTPTPCVALAGILQGEHPVFIAQQPHAELLMPEDDNNVPVGFPLAANQMVKIEFHTINTTNAQLTVSGSAYLDTIPLSSTVTVSDLAFWGTEKFTIPPLASYSTEVLYQAGIPGTKSFALTTHQHHLGVQMQVWYGTGATDTSNRVANGIDWSNPPIDLYSPPLDFPSDGSMGLAYQCTWNNTTTQPVSFGESFYDEMCFLWHYYYPAQGFQYCVNNPTADGGFNSKCQ